MPAGAEIFVRKGQRLARWKDSKGKTRTAPLTVGEDGSDRLLIESPYYIAKYRDGKRLVQEVSTGCRDESAARQVLADLERRAELVKAGVMSNAESAVADHSATAIAEHFAAFEKHLRAKGVTDVHREDTGRFLRRLAKECSFSTLAELSREKLEHWLALKSGEGMSARTRNAYRNAAVAFGNWGRSTNRLTENPFSGTPKANEKADPRRQRRALTEAELCKLLNVARSRPVLDRMTVRRGERKGQVVAKLSDRTRAELELIGRERALIYKALVLTGLRKGELESLTVAHLSLDGPDAFATLDAADEKNREGNAIALRDDLAADLREWLSDKLGRLQRDARARGEPIPARLPPDTPIFDVPSALVKILDRDLVAAGLARIVEVNGKKRVDKRDDRGRSIDVHALRTTFGTLLSKGGVAPRTAQAAMRHSDIRLTMGVYTDPKLLDVRAALGVLPALPLDGTGSNQAKVTGTDDSALAPVLAPTWCKRGASETIHGKSQAIGAPTAKERPLVATSSRDKRKEPQTTGVSGSLNRGERIRTSDLLNPIQAR